MVDGTNYMLDYLPLKSHMSSIAHSEYGPEVVTFEDVDLQLLYWLT